jgi:RNA polymerase sigma-70 factor (ECF subfamily)
MSRDPSLGPSSRASDRRRFEAFYRQNFGSISRYVARRLPDDSHDDVVSKTFVVAWKKFDRVLEPSLPWLYRIASFEVLYERRRLAGERIATNAEELVGPETIASDDTDEVAAALRQLSDHDAELLHLIYWEELSRAEVALVLGCTVNTVNVRYHRAIERVAGAHHRLANTHHDQPGAHEPTKETP